MHLKNTFYFLRHADTDKTSEVHFSQYPLSNLGLEQAQMIVPKLIDLNLDHIYASPFVRTIDTISPFITHTGKDLVVKENLCGRILGDIPKPEIWEFFQKSWFEPDYTIYSSETANECLIRIQKVLQDLEKKHRNKKILLVSHSNPIALYLRSINPKVDWKWFQSMPSPVLIELQPHQPEGFSIKDLGL